MGYCAGQFPNPPPNPSYQKVCNDPSFGAYVETIQVDFEPSLLSYEDILDAFFRLHDARGASFKRQYASIIFTHDEEQRRYALEALDPARHPDRARASTSVELASDFWDAEPYHQKWLLQRKRPLMLALGLTQTEELLDGPATVLNGYAAGRMTAQATMERFDELLQSGELDQITHQRLQAALFSRN